MKLRDIFNAFTPERVEDKKEFQGSFTIMQEAPGRTTRDIQDFLTALRSAEGHHWQDRIKLYTIYQENLDYDAHMLGLIDRRLDNIQNKDLTFLINEKESEDIENWAQSPRFRKFLAELIMVRFWGMGLFEFKTGEWFDYFLIPIKHVNPYKQEILKRQNDNSGVSYKDKKEVMFVGGKNDFGLFKTLTPLCIHKRNLMNYWSTYAELAGNNFMAVNYRLLDPAKKNDLELALRNVKGGKPFMKPEGVDMEVTNLTSSSQNALFENYYKTLNQEQSRLILGQTMTTEQGSSRSQAEVHERTQSEIFASDEKYILDLLNYEFHEYHKLWNIPEGKWTFRDDSSVKLLAEIEKDLKLKELGYKFSQEYIADKYQLPYDPARDKEEDVPDKDGLDGDDMEGGE